MKRMLFYSLLLLLSNTGSAQYKLHPATLGARFNLLHFPANHKANKQSYSPGIGFQYILGLYQRVDLGFSIDGSFEDQATGTLRPSKSLLAAFEASMRFRFFESVQKWQPFLSSGLGLSQYNGYSNAFLPLGGGLEWAAFRDAYIITQAQYRISIPVVVRPHFFLSLGVSGNLRPGKTRKKATAPVLLPTLIPPRDRDQDGIVDSLDHCPDIPGMAKFNGCPDRDGDGIIDKEDRCPDLAGLARYGGCPIPDTDGDGINDEEDSCIKTPGLARYQGCPAPDRDRDGIPDEEDQCPDLAGTASGKGCPAPDSSWQQTANRIAAALYFETGSYLLSVTGRQQLDSLCELLHQQPQLRVQIEGHTDSIGKKAANLLLSSRRANAILQYLTENGVAANRLQATGYGSSRPIADNTSASGRSRNRRVELKLLY